MHRGLFILQGMMGFPIVMVFVMVIGFCGTYFIISFCNIILKEPENPDKKGIKPFWYSVAGAFLLLAWFLYKMLTFDGPWIN